MSKLLLISLLSASALLAQPQGPAYHAGAGPTLPSVCSPLSGDIFFLFSASSATGDLYNCTGKNIWTLAGFHQGGTSFADLNPATSYFTSAVKDYGSLTVNQGAFPVFHNQTANHSSGVLGQVMLPATGAGGIVAIGIKGESGNKTSGGANFGAFFGGYSYALNSLTFGLNGVATDCEGKSCILNITPVHGARAVAVQENDKTTASVNTKIAFGLSLEVAPTSTAMAGNGSVAKDYGIYLDNAADTVASSVTNITGTPDFIIDPLANPTGNVNTIYNLQVGTNGTPDTFQWTPFGSVTGLSGTDLAAPTGTTITSVSHNPVINDGPAMGFTNGDIGQVVQVTAGTNYTTGFYVITGVTTGTATVDSTICTSAPCAGGSFVLWEATQNTITGTDLVIDGATNTKVTSVAHTFVAADINQPINITSVGTGPCTVGWRKIISVNAGAATLSSSAGALGSTGCGYTLNTIQVPMSASPVWLTLPLDSTVNPYFQGSANRTAATSQGIAINNTITTGHNIGDKVYFAVTGVPNFSVGVQANSGSINNIMTIPPLFGGPNSQSVPLNWGATNTSNTSIVDTWFLDATGTYTQKIGSNIIYQRDISGNVAAKNANFNGKILDVAATPATLNGTGTLTAGNLISGTYLLTNSGAMNATFIAAANVVAQMPISCNVGNRFDVAFRAPNQAGTVTFLAGTGNTLDPNFGTWSLASGAVHSILARGIVTNCTTPAVTYYILTQN